MTRTDYLRLRKIHRATRDPELGRMLLAYERDRRPRSPAEVKQLRLVCVEVYCDPQGGRISLAACILQQSAATPSGRGKGFMLREACKGCHLRDTHRAMAPGWAPPPYRAFSIARDNAQRAARRRLWRTGALDVVPTIDAPHGDDQ